MFKVHAKRVSIFAVLGLIVAFLIASNLPKLYEARSELLIENTLNFRDYDPTIQAILSRYASPSIETEIGMLQSKSLFQNALVKVAEKTGDADLLKKADTLYGYYGAGTNGDDSKLAILEVRAHSPELAEAILNEIAEYYNTFRAGKNRESLNDGANVLATRVNEAKAEMDKTEEQLRRFKAENNITDPRVEAEQLAAYQNQLTQQRDAAQSLLASTVAEIGVQKQKLEVLPKHSELSISQVQTPLVQEYKTRLAKLQADRLAALEKYQPTSERIKEFDRLIKELQDRLVNEQSQQWEVQNKNMQIDPIRAQIEAALAANEVARQSLQSKIATANRLLNQTNSKISQLPARDARYNQYLREFDIRQKQYMSYLSQQEDLKRKIDQASGAALQLFAPEASDEPVAPSVGKLAIVGAIAGIVLGILFSFLIESLRLPVRSSAQLADLTGLPVSATIPQLSRGKAARMLAGLPDPNYKPGESFRFMAFSQLAREGGAPKLILFTGIGGSVGCSSSAAQFALATARTGVKTLLVDCDLRHPAITTSFEANEQSGVSDMLNRTMLASEADMSLETAHKNLRLVPAGTDGEGGLSDFPTSHIVGIVNNLAEKADVVVIDAPPCDIVADAARLVPYVDQVCLVVSAQSTSFRSVPMAYEILKRSGAKEISLILTHASPQDEPFSKRSRYLVSA